MPKSRAVDPDKDPRVQDRIAKGIEGQIGSPMYKSMRNPRYGTGGDAHVDKLEAHDAASAKKVRAKAASLRAPQTRRELLEKAYDEQDKMLQPFDKLKGG